MNGKDYVALRRLSNAADDTLADVGESCEQVPAASLPALLASGKIALKDRPLKKRRAAVKEPHGDR